MSAPQDRLAEIKVRAARALPDELAAYADHLTAQREDRDWLIAEVERLRGAEVIASRLLASVQDLATELTDPGTEALAAIYEARQFFHGCPPSDDLINRAALAIAEELDHHDNWDTPEGPCCDSTIPCHHQPEQGCDECAQSGWPCAYAKEIARLVLSEISPFGSATAPGGAE